MATIAQRVKSLLPFALGLLLLACSAQAAESIRYVPDKRLWVIDTNHTTYALGVNQIKGVQHVYWGKKLTTDRDLPATHTDGGYAFESAEGLTNEEYPGWGGMRYTEPCLKVTLADGVRDLVLKYVSHQISGDTLQIRLKDVKYDLFATLTYHVYPRNDVIERRTTIENGTKQPVVLESAQSAVWYMPASDGYRLSYLTGKWGGETQLIREDIHPGIKLLESRRGTTSHQMNPWFAIDGPARADEEHGRVWFGALGWSGNWRFSVEQTPYQQLRVTGGYNTFDFGYSLKPGEKLETPPFYASFTDRGFGEASRIFHRFEREQILPDRAAPHVRPLLYNSWEATEFNVNEAGQKQLAEKAAKIGVELFVMDDGWFGARNDDHAGLGDWYVNPKKFPNGLKALISYVNGLGMKFGLWVEPEMVNPNSDLYRKHPDWVINMKDRPRTEGRNQVILNIARDEVKEYVFGVLDKLLSENNIKFFKWDMNRHFTEPGWPEVAAEDQKMIWVKYVDNYYSILERLRAKHPDVDLESCSGGGGRIDMGVLNRVDEVWTSDNTDALDRLKIQEGLSFAYTTKAMMAWVTDVPNFVDHRTVPLQYRFLVAMMGSLGLGSDLNKWTKEDFDLATKMVAYYKQIRGTVQQGNLYRLFSPREGELTANEYVSGDGKQAVVFAFLRSQQFRRNPPVIYLRGLDENATYRVVRIDDKLQDKPETLSGSYLMNHGLTFKLIGDYDSTSATLEKQ